MKINIIKQGNTFYPYAKEDEDKMEKFSNAIYVVDIKNQDLRTLQQNKAVHLWATQIADLLNSKGLFMKGVFGKEIMWTKELVKEQIIKETMKKIFNIDSTTKIQRKELDGLIDYVCLAFGTRSIVLPPFPNRELWEEIKK